MAPSPIEEIILPVPGRRVFVKRDDLLHPVYGGNKWRKMKYNLAHMRGHGMTSLVTFGGPFSNHIHAIAGLARDEGLQAVAYIRGSTGDQGNPVLSYARACGMRLNELSRKDFARRRQGGFLRQLRQAHPNACLIPEGGTNALALPGCAEIVDEVEQQLGFVPDCWIVPGGTGGTAVGIADRLAGRAEVIVITALQRHLFEPTFSNTLEMATRVEMEKVRIVDQFHFGGLAQWDHTLINAIREVRKSHDLPLDPVYTGKAWFGMAQLMRAGEIHASASVLFLHTGGRAGAECFRYRFGAV